MTVTILMSLWLSNAFCLFDRFSSMQLPIKQAYSQLPERFFHRTALTPVVRPSLIKLNRVLASELGFDFNYLSSAHGIQILAGNSAPESIDPIALAYAGHQFGHFVPQLGDGRALLLGEVIDGKGNRFDVQLKGSGPTIFSRQGDGRAALGPILREYIISEAMAALGIPTTRALAAVGTGEIVIRDQPRPGAILTRIAASHIRIGTFQFFAARGDIEAVRILADYAIQRHYPEARDSSSPYFSFFEQVIKAQAILVSKWMAIGFIHGVMNTDNMSIAGETIDYGPCAFMDAYNPDTVFSSIDRNGRYAYSNQPSIAFWNLARFGETLLPLLSNDETSAVKLAKDALNTFSPIYEAEFMKAMSRKIGLTTHQSGDDSIIQDLLTIMAKCAADFTSTFRTLAYAASDTNSINVLKALDKNKTSFYPWLAKWKERLLKDPQNDRQRHASMLNANPLYIPRNHKVEEVIDAAVNHQDFGPFEDLNIVLANPFTEQPDRFHYAEPPGPNSRIYQTYCGT